MDVTTGFIGTRAKRPRTIALIACFATAFAIGGCGGDNSGAPATPVLSGVLDQGCAEVPASTGEFKVLPAEKVRLRVRAAWPSADLVVKANGAELEKVGPSDTGRQSDLKNGNPQTGQQPMPYWVPEDIDPNPTPPAWTVGVTLPPSMRAGPLKLELTSRTPGGQSSSPLTVDLAKDDANPTAGGGMNLQAQAPAWNRVDLSWRDRGDEIGYLLERSESGGPYTGLVSIGTGGAMYSDTHVQGETQYSYRLTAQGCGPVNPQVGAGTGSATSTAAVTTPREAAPAPRTGVDEIDFSPSPDPNDDQFDYTNPLLIFMPEDAVVTSVTNISTDDRNPAQGIPLGSVRHTDADGASSSLLGSCPTGILAPQESTTVFNGRKVEGAPGGGWKVRVCANAVFLDPPARIALRIAWTQP